MNQNPITRNEPVLLQGTIGSIVGVVIGYLINYLFMGNDFSYFPMIVVLGFGMGAALGMHFATKGKSRPLSLRIITTLIALCAAAAFLYQTLQSEDPIFSIGLIVGAGITAWITSKEGAIRPNLFGEQTQKEN